MRREILAKNVKIAALETASEEARREYEGKLKALKHRLETSEAAAQTRFDEMEVDLSSRIDAAVEELNAVVEFKLVKVTFL